MRRIYRLFFSISIVCLLCGCTHTNTLKEINIITSCGVVTGENANDYLFCVSDVSSSEEENGGKETFSLYRFTAPDFSDAVNQLKSTVGIVDFGHFVTLISDFGYVNRSLYKDIDYMSSELMMNPIMKYFVCPGDIEKTIKNINSQYGQGADDFLSKVYNRSEKRILCTFAEILFSSENNVFTASVPVIDSDENNLVSEKSILLCSSDGIVEVLPDDYMFFRNFIKKYGKNSKKLDFEISGDLMKIRIKPLSTPEETKLIADLAEKYKLMNIDILNAIYFSKKHFPTYSSYIKFTEQIPVGKLHYE